MKPLGAEPLPGAERVRPKYPAGPEKGFLMWAALNAFKYPPEALPFLERTDSAAECFFVRAFFELPAARRDRLTVSQQVPVGLYRIDFLLECGAFRLAIEVDGLTYHGRKYDQIAADYLRDRRIVCAGYTVIRFTAQEVFGDPSACWRQILAIVDARTSHLPPLKD